MISYQSIRQGIQNQREQSRALKGPVPDGAIDLETFKKLPEGTLFWMVWKLGPESWITPAKTRKISIHDETYEDLGLSHLNDWSKKFPYTNMKYDEYKNENFRKYATEHYASYNLGPEAYNDSYICLMEDKALTYLEHCKKQPRYKTEEERQSHQKLMRDMNLALMQDMDYLSESFYSDD